MKLENIPQHSLEFFDEDGGGGARYERPWLLADIGGTNARFGLQTAAGRIDAIWVAECAAYPTLGAAIVQYLSRPATVAAGGYQARQAGIAIANPIDGDWVRMTNHHWSFSVEAICSQFSLRSLHVVNDFAALARSVPFLSEQHRVQVGGGAPRLNGVVGLVGAGTGLGVSGLVPVGREWMAMDSEGGHCTFAAVSEREIDILRYAQRQFEHVSAERLVSGPGIRLTYQALAARGGVAAQDIDTAQIIERGLRGECLVCVETLEAFCEMLGTMAGNVAITLGSRGGVYIGGGIVPRLGGFFSRSGFRRRFEQKGRFSDYLAQIPTYVITAEYPALIGMSVILAEIA
ncbi:glucokinase [Pseudoduganella namucuonensis]|uniref:Glucokinase n=1 Tax=Pseudoduganella namucuonensis TaxID=1035707 RepID=A0A1I7I2N0_9BURK|nr:glucokinase [Pseudoduganella namucuonensis]SFU67175.1 glucokinase [Pseudoduganella namucuonensis]